MAKLITPICAALAITILASPANAGRITARATQSFCQVVAIDCNQSNLNSCPLIFSGPLGQGQVLTSFSGHLCYKRSNNPSNCASGLAGNWSCFSNTLNAPDDGEEIR